MTLGEMISADAAKTLESLNSLAPKKCDDDLLAKMRTAQYKSDFAKDIGYTANNELICTTGLGVFNRPFKEPPPQFYSPRGYGMWLDVPIKLFDFQRMGTVVKHKNFNVVMNLSNFFDSAINGHQSAIYARTDKGGLIFQAGDSKLTPEKSCNYDTFDITGFYSFKCAKTSIICAISYIPLSEVFKEDMGQIFGIFTLSFLSATLLTLLLKSYLKRLITFENIFLRNMNHDKIKCFYQPVVNTDTKKVVGCEVLVRWQDENEQIITPDKFLNIVRNVNKSKEFTDIVIENTFKDLAPILKKIPDFRVSFNIFPKCFKYDILIKQFEPYRKKYPNLHINLELTEDELVEAPKISECINKMRNEGFIVSIDDFGTGYSSLSYFQEITVDYIKIDRSFVKDLEQGTVKSQLIPLIVSIAQTTGADIIVEGVETETQYAFIQDLGIKYIQGYYFSRPLPLREFTSYLSSNI